MLMLAVGLPGMTTIQLGRDEAATWTAAARSFADFRWLMHNLDAVMAPYYLFMHAWIRVFGDSPLAMRTPSLLAMIGAAGAVALVGKRLGGTACGIGAGLLFAVIPTVSRFAHDARGYALATFGAILSILFLLRAMERPTWLRWALYAGAVTMSGAGHLVALLVVIGHACAVAWWFTESRDRRAWRWLIASCVGVAPLLPLAYRGRNQHWLQLGGVPIPDLAVFHRLPTELLQGATTAGALVTLALLSPLVLFRRTEGAELRRAGVVMLLGVAFGSPAALWVASQDMSMWYPKYLVFTTSALAILAVLVLAQVSTRLVLTAFLAVGALCLTDHQAIRQPLAHEHFNYPSPYPGWFPPPTDYDRAAQIMIDDHRPGDALLYADPRDVWRTLMVDYRMRTGDRPRDVLAFKSRERTGSFGVAECPDLKACFGAPQRVWVVTLRHPDDPLANAPDERAALLRGAYDLRERHLVAGLTVSLYARA
jgi:mannosyltransferase